MQMQRIASSVMMLALAGSAAALVPNSTAPEFKGVDSNGKTQTLSQYRGKYVVLEWAN